MFKEMKIIFSFFIATTIYKSPIVRLTEDIERPDSVKVLGEEKGRIRNTQERMSILVAQSGKASHILSREIEWALNLSQAERRQLAFKLLHS